MALVPGALGAFAHEILSLPNNYPQSNNLMHLVSMQASNQPTTSVNRQTVIHLMNDS